MLIGIDAGPMIGHGGISEYVGSLMRKLIIDDQRNQYRLVFRRSWSHLSGVRECEQVAPIVRLSIPDRFMSLWWDRMHCSLPVGRALWKSLDVYLSTCLMTPILPRGEVVSVIYDLIPLRLPTLFPHHADFRRLVRRICARSAALVTISHCTKDDLVELLGIDPAKIHVVYPGRHSQQATIAPACIATVTQRHGINGPYILYAGSLGRHKNVEALLRAYQLARGEGLLGATLVIAGSCRWGKDVLRLVETLELSNHVTFTDYVAGEDLQALYAGADLFVYPSLYEGFGLPVLEAMACGTPVLVSKSGALPEVIGEAGLAVNTEDPRTLADALIRVMGDAGLRLHLREAGLRRAKRFSWSRSADQLRQLLERTTAESR
ncbi:MAG: glycosyltransferase family 1 protein [Nitrospiraceae bacterium]